MELKSPEEALKAEGGKRSLLMPLRMQVGHGWISSYCGRLYGEWRWSKCTFIERQDEEVRDVRDVRDV